MSKRLKVLFLASDCNPAWHSLPALIYEYYCALKPHADITLVTHIRNKEHIDAVKTEQDNIIYLDTELIARPFFRLAQFLARDPNKAMTLQVALSYPSNIYFEFCVWRRYKSALQSGKYDIVHRASPMSPTIPSPMASWSPIPFVIGPVLGGLPWPKVFRNEMRREGEWMNYLRKAHVLMPYYRSTYRRASAILAGYKHTVGDIPKKDHKRVIEFSEGGIHPEDFPEKKFKSSDKRTILFVGRMVPFKQPEVLIRCFEKSETLRKHHLILVGDGPELVRLRELVEELNLSSSIELTGSVSITRVREMMYESDIFAFPSIREQGGGVITMASMSSTPSVVVDYGGPATRVPEGCGIKVPLGDVGQIIDSFTKELEALVESPETIKKLGLAAREFTQNFYSWSWKATKTMEIYEWVLGRVSRKPDFWQKD